MYQMRAVSLTGYATVAEAVGLDAQAMLREARIAPQSLKDPHNFLPAAKVIRLLERSAEQSGHENFGLLMSEMRSFASLGPLSLLLERLPNMRESLRAAIDFQRQLSDVVTLSMEDHDDVSLVRLDILPAYHGAQVIDMMMGVAYRVLLSASGGRWRPDRVHFMHKAPADSAPWQRFFSTPVDFDNTFDGFATTSQALAAPNPLANELMAGHARRLLELMPARGILNSFSDRVSRVITLLLPSGRASVSQAAEQLGLSPRTLQRHLEDEGEQFGRLVEAVRRELAIGYLMSSDRPITSIASLLGYASPSSFTRWFSGAFGQSPQAWRADHLAETEGPPPIWRR